MKVVCINNESNYETGLTLGKIYIVNKHNYKVYDDWCNFYDIDYGWDRFYNILNDNGEGFGYSKQRFRILSKSEERNEKIDKLLEDES